jgi:hypothetical protein
MDIPDDELFAALGQSINELILRHRKHLQRNAKKGVLSWEFNRIGLKPLVRQPALKNVG